MENEAERWQNAQVSYSGEFKLLEAAAEEDEEECWQNAQVSSLGESEERVRKIVSLNNTPGKYTAQDIIEYLDKVPYTSFFFIDLEHPYFYTANSRLTLFADETRWAIVFEKSGYANRGFQIQLEVNYFGNCLENLESTGRAGSFFNSHYITLVDHEELTRIEKGFEEIREDIEEVKVRDRYVKIPKTKQSYQKWIPNLITRNYPEEVTFVDLGRYVAYEYEELCRATDEELRHCIPTDLPKIMMIDKWHHKSCPFWDETGTQPGSSDGDPPSSYETYRLIADVLEKRDPTRFKPILKPNNHWINWPQAGSL